MYEELKKEIRQIKEGRMTFPQRELHRMHGKVQMARELEALTHDEFMDLDKDVIRDGINNPKYFDCRNCVFDVKESVK